MLEAGVSGQVSAAGPAPARRVLIVEDEPLIGMLLKDCLESRGSQVVWVQTDRAAYIALNGSAPAFDTLILDIDLGEGTTGFDVARYARSRFPDIGVIYSSGSPPDWLSTYGVERALYLPKPCNEARLLGAFDQVGTREEASSLAAS